MKDECTPQQTLAAELLAIGHTVGHVAAKVGVRRETMHRWMREAPFKAIMDEATRARVAAIRRQGLRKLPKITKALEAIVLDEVTVEDELTGEPVTRPRAKDADRIAAADRLLKVHGLMRDSVEVSGPNGGPIAITADDLASADEATLRAIAAAANREPDAEPA